MALFTIVDIVPQTHSNETWQDAEPSIGVNLADPSQIVVSAFTPPDSGDTNGPIYYSEDSGSNWSLSFIVPGGEPNDQTFKFGSRSNQFYGAILSDGSLTYSPLRASDPFVPGTMTSLESIDDNDQPFITATTVEYGPDTGKDRFYVGINDLSVYPGDTAAIDVCLDAAAASPTITRHYVDKRSTGSANQDGPQVRVAAHADGTIYAIFAGWRGESGPDTTMDVVVVRDDDWASGGTPFTALIDPGDSVAGYRVQTGVSIVFNQSFGQERTGGSFAIAVDPRDSDRVIICWAGLSSSVYTLNVQMSTNRGATWSSVLLQVPNATNPALAISTTGKIGILYQQDTGTSPNDRWETHFQESTNGSTWTDTVLASTPAETPPLNTGEGLTYIGDYLDMVAVGKNFYGTFCANNTPDPANFPTVMATYLRNIDASTHQLLGVDNVTLIPASIDPFFVQVTELPAYSDFYVRDWTTSPSDADTGLEPSTNPDFWGTSDVWNQHSTNVSLPPNSNDQPTSENAQAGADNYAFARIRRNLLPPSGSGSVTVSAHFLVSEFGTGSNFVDWIFSDPSDPDVTFPSPTDPTVTFGETDLGPFDTPPFTWNLADTTSDHLCLAVEINAPGDPASAPGLTGLAPGTNKATDAVINDNNKAQRNLQVNLGAANSRGANYYGIVHNGATIVRDVTLGLTVPSGADLPARDATIEVITAQGVVAHQPFTPFGTITLRGMTPGENRWIGVTLPLPTSTSAPAVAFAELKGNRPVNGFSVAAKGASLDAVIGDLVGFYRRVLIRLQKGFGVSAAGTALGELDGNGHDKDGDREGFDFHEHVSATERDLKIEVDVRIRRGSRAGRRESPGEPSIAIGATNYGTIVAGQVSLLRDALSELSSSDPFAIRDSLTALGSVPAGDTGAMTTAHATVLHKFDAFMTMLQKANGDRADIAQMVRWQRDLCERSSRLAALADTPWIESQCKAFLARVEARTLQLAEYRGLLTSLAPALQRIATALGAAGTLDPLIGTIRSASGTRAQEKAHREFLLALERFA
jgi:hypothetical protein